MEDETQTTQTKTSPIIVATAFLGLGFAVVAAVLGGIALKKISTTSEEINARIEKNASIELDIKKISDRVDSLALQVENIKSTSDGKVSELVKQVQNVVNVLNGNINEIRGEVVKNREAIEKIAAKPTQPKQVVQKSEPENAQAAPEESALNGKVHKIQNGDTFAKLAKKYKVSVDAIVKANPQANPSRLKIGQEMTIP